MSDGERAIWNDMQVGEAPDVRVLWNDRPRARENYRCDRCGEMIPAGEQYESIGLIEDGVFLRQRQHIGAAHYPSGCPSIGEQDAAELADQFEKDIAAFGGAL